MVCKPTKQLTNTKETNQLKKPKMDGVVKLPSQPNKGMKNPVPGRGFFNKVGNMTSIPCRVAKDVVVSNSCHFVRWCRTFKLRGDSVCVCVCVCV